MPNPTSSAEILREEFERRKSETPRLSLRAFAKFLGISPSTLSLVLAGKRRLGARAAIQIANRCNLSPARRSALISFGVGTPVDIAVPKVEDRNYLMVDSQQFSRIASWKHYAILSLGDLARCRFEKKWIARRLNISEDEAETAMNDLLSLGLIKSTNGKFRRITQPIRTKSDVSDKTIQHFHSQLMDKACESLERYDVKDRDITAITMPVNKKRLRVAKKRIKEFRRGLFEYLSQGPKDEVYALQISLFPLSWINESSDTKSGALS